MKFKTNKGFTLIEVLVVIVIIGVIAALATVALGVTKVKTRDAKRISDIKQMQTALELYYNEENTYPPTNALVAGQALVGAVSGKTFMTEIPAGPNTGETYNYAQINNGISYILGYTLEKPVNEFAAGTAVAFPGNINTQCSSNCSGKCNISDGCGGVCPNNCSGGTPYCSANVCSATKPTPCSEITAAAAECTASSAYGAICGGGYLVCKTGDANSNDCGNINLVAAPSNCTGTSGDMGTVCNCATDTLTKTWNDTSPGSALGLNDAVYGLNNFSDGTDGTTATAFYTGNTANYDAAKYCFDLSITVGGVTYSDWYLPAAKELAAIIKSSEPFYSYSSTKYASNAYYGENTTNATLQSATTHYTTTSLITTPANSRVSGLDSTGYWSSTEYNATNAWGQNAINGNQSYANKTSARYVRCVRRF